jgi:hypothetical protein
MDYYIKNKIYFVSLKGTKLSFLFRNIKDKDGIGDGGRR